MKTKCCLIAVGGSGYKLKKDGIEFPYSKSSLQLLGKPMIHWLLEMLEETGIRKIVMTSERKDSLEFVRKVSNDFINNFDEILFHQNSGFGFCGLPFQCKDFIDFPCFFEAGHSFNTPEHYEKMDKEYKKDCLIASGFPPKGHSPRNVIKIENGKMKYIGMKFSIPGEIEVGSPKLFGEEFIDNLPRLGYDFSNILPYYIENNKLKIVYSVMPLEADVKKEWNEAIPAYEEFIRNRRQLPRLSNIPINSSSSH
jgi:hypothetical protein